jgi:hypothetical protein
LVLLKSFRGVRSTSPCILSRLMFCTGLALACVTLHAQNPTLQHKPNGLLAKQGGAVLELTALREDDLQVSIGPQQGSFKPWWNSYRFEVYGGKPKRSTSSLSGNGMPEPSGAAFSVEVPAAAAGEVVKLR